jgi:superfamily II DNA or RNA helicase
MDNEKIIYITSTGILICPYVRKEHQDFERIFSTRDYVYHSMKNVTGIYVKSKETKEGMYLAHRQKPEFLQKYFPHYKIIELSYNSPKKIQCEFALNDKVIPTDIEYTIVNKVLKLINKPEWFVHLQGGYGKTLLSVQLMTLLQTKVMIMCYSTAILKQWNKTLCEKTTFNPKRILIIDSSNILESIYEHDYDIGKFDIFMATPTVITNYCEKTDFRRLNDIFRSMGIGLKIFDEAHRDLSNIVKINASTSVEKTLYLSADFAQSDSRRNLLYQRMFFGVPIIEPDEQRMRDLSYIVAIVAYYNSHPSSVEYANVFTNRGFNGYNYMRYQLNKPDIFQVLDRLFNVIGKKISSNHRVLIMVNLVEHADTMYDYFNTHYGNKFKIGKYYAELSDAEKEYTKNDAEIIIATNQSFGTGIDALGIRYVIMLNQASIIEDNQAARRARPQQDGSECFYFMLVDQGFKYAVKKLKRRISYLIETKIKKVVQVKY